MATKKRPHPQSASAIVPASFAAAAPPPLELEDFEAYVEFRILDSIGHPGVYRKFLFKRRDQNIEWAVHKCARITAVQNAMKNLSYLEQDIKSSHGLRNLHVVWQHVVESNTPPSDMQLTIATCIITGKANVPCVIIKSKGRGAANFNVSSKFATFLYHLWITYKQDILIKVYARRCIDEIDPAGVQTLQELVDAIKARANELSSISRSLHAAYMHVTRSAVAGLMAVV